MNAYVRAVAFASRVAGVIAAVLIALSIVAVCEQIFQRSVLGNPAIWQNEFVTYSIIAATFLGSPYVLLTRGHVSVDVIPAYLGPRGRLVLAVIAGVCALAFCAAVWWTSLDWWWERWETGETKSSIWSPRLWIPSLSLPVGFGLLILQYISELWQLIAGGAEAPKPELGAGHDETHGV
jgi:TRAP-type C4-dicarboxylate transport system permease small subunit